MHLEACSSCHRLLHSMGHKYCPECNRPSIVWATPEQVKAFHAKKSFAKPDGTDPEQDNNQKD